MRETTVEVNLGYIKNLKLDLTQEMLHAGDLVAQEMRGNVKAGLDVHDVPLKANEASYAKQKQRKLGHARPLIAKNRSLVTPSNYEIKRVGQNHVTVGLKGSHPTAKMKIGQLAYIHNYGLGNAPKREFAGITRIAVRRIMAYLNDRITRLFK